MVEKTNSSGTLLASAARTASVNSPTIEIRAGASIRVYIDVSATADTPSVVPTIQGQDPVSGDWFDILAGTALVDTDDSVMLVVCPTAAAVTNLVAAVPCPSTWRLEMVAADGDALTYSASYEAYVL